MASQAFSDFLLGGSGNSDVASFSKRLYKRVVKTGISLFLSADFVKDHMLVAAVKKINIIPADLLIIMSVLITINGRDFIYVNLSHSNIYNHFNTITQAISSTMKKTWTDSKNILLHCDETNDVTKRGVKLDSELLTSFKYFKTL